MTFAPLLRSVLLAAMCGTAGVHAQAPSQSAPARPAADDSLYQAFGARPGLIRLMDEFMVRLLADPRMNPFFKDTNQQHVKAQLVAQLCQLSGGPCRLDGPDMKRAHSGMDITKSDFNALVEVLQLTMDAQDIPFRVQNQLLALLAPMHRDIVNTP
jgi:hemoglobin